ncbi:uridine monophosphate kinase [Candidatus Gracilibacteria bacterium]|nr:uridine monophosphate kinase [Candidatus Gracilibacteria bacterium]
MKRILLKISGEAFSSNEEAIDIRNAKKVAEFIAHFYTQGYEIAIVLGGGNIYRGSKLIAGGLKASDSHSMSMLSTVFNAVTLKNTLQDIGMSAVVLDALHVEFLESYTSEKGKNYLKQGNIVICSSGIGNPFFTTDTTGVLRALELECEIVVKLTKVDGVYDKDPIKYSDAIYYSEISCDDFLQRNLQVFDATGIILARDNKLPLYISKIGDIEAFTSILLGKKAGTKIF